MGRGEYIWHMARAMKALGKLVELTTGKDLGVVVVVGLLKHTHSKHEEILK